MVDEILHYGVPRRSGRYPWGSGKNPRAGRVSAAKRKLKEHLEEKKSERASKTAKSRNDRYIRKGLKRLPNMTPEQTDKFLQKASRIAKAEAVAEARMKTATDAKQRELGYQSAKIDAINSLMKITGTSMSIAKKVSNNPEYKDLEGGITALSKAMKTVKTQNPGKPADKVAPTPREVDIYIKATHAKKEEAVKRLRSVKSLTGGGTDLASAGVTYVKTLKKFRETS